MTRSLLLTLVLLVLPSQLLAQPAAPAGMFEIIPKDASAALVLRSIHDFKTKGNQLLKDLQINNLGPLTPDSLVDVALRELKLEGGVDEKAPVALSILSGKMAGFEMLENLVLHVPIADRKKILAGFKFDADIKDNEVVDLKTDGFLSPRALVVRGKYLCMGLSDAPLKRLTDDSLPVSAVEKKQFADADVLLYLGKETWPVVWGEYLTRLDRYFSRRKDEEERIVGQQFIKGLQATQHSFVSLRVEDGVRLRSNMVFDVKKEKAARAMLDMLKAGTSHSSLKGLADGKALAALGWAADGSKNGILTKLFFDVFLEGPLPGKLNDLPIFASTDYPSVVAVSHEISQRLKGVRIALYHNENEKELGLVSALAVIDTEGGAAFLKEVRTLARIADLKPEDLKLPEIKKLVDVDQLVRDLNSEKFPVRQSAATRLHLLGEAALPALERGIAKPLSLEQRRRIDALKVDVDRAIAQRRKEFLLVNELPRSIRPNFTIAPDIEKRAGVTVDVLKMSFNTKQPAFLKKVEQMLGPNWDKLRLAVVGNQVVVLLGSDVKLLEQSIVALKSGKGGLADSNALAGFEKRADKSRTAEMHGSAQGFLGLLATEWKLPMKLFRDPAEMTSLAISFEEDRMQLDLWVPTRELRTMVHAVVPGL